MKCDELKDYDIMDIEAMDDERLEKSESGKIQVTRVYIKPEVEAAIDELKAENERLKAKLEDVQATAYTDSVDAGMENQKLKRALWLARAKRAQEMAWNFHEKNLVEKCAKWDNVHLMLLAKAEEYK